MLILRAHFEADLQLRLHILILILVRVLFLPFLSLPYFRNYEEEWFPNGRRTLTRTASFLQPGNTRAFKRAYLRWLNKEEVCEERRLDLFTSRRMFGWIFGTLHNNKLRVFLLLTFLNDCHYELPNDLRACYFWLQLITFFSVNLTCRLILRQSGYFV